MSNDEIRIRTNNVPRDVVEAYELTDKERQEFDYYDWQKVEAGEESATFFRYKGTLYDLGEFMTTSGRSEFNPLRKWDGYSFDSVFSGVVVRFVDDCERVIVGEFFA